MFINNVIIPHKNISDLSAYFRDFIIFILNRISAIMLLDMHCLIDVL